MAPGALPETDITTLVGRVFRPERPRLAEARTLVRGLTEVHAAWSALVAGGLARPMGRERVFKVQGGQAFEHPMTVDECLALAGDPHGIAQAEVHAAEVARRLEPWGAPIPMKVAWRVIDPSRIGPAEDPALSLIQRALFADPEASAEYNRAFNQSRAAFKSRLNVRSEARVDFASNAAWNAVGGRLAPPEGLVAGPLPNPFEPLLAIWSLGYALYAIRREGLTLLAPAIEEGLLRE